MPDRVTSTDDLNETTQRVVEILQIGEQLRHSWSIPGGTEPAGFHTGEELIGTRPRLSEPISVSETRHHLERVHFYVRLLTQCRQFPQENPEGPLGRKENILLDRYKTRLRLYFCAKSSDIKLLRVIFISLVVRMKLP